MGSSVGPEASASGHRLLSLGMQLGRLLVALESQEVAGAFEIDSDRPTCSPYCSEIYSYN